MAVFTVHVFGRPLCLSLFSVLVLLVAFVARYLSLEQVVPSASAFLCSA